MNSSQFKTLLKECNILIKKYVNHIRDINVALSVNPRTNNLYKEVFNIFNIQDFSIRGNEIVKKERIFNEIMGHSCSIGVIHGLYIFFKTTVTGQFNDAGHFFVKVEKNKKPFIYFIKKYTDKEKLNFDNVKLQIQKLYFEFII